MIAGLTNRDRYLEHEFLTAYKNSKIVLLRPSMAHMLKQSSQLNVVKVRVLKEIRLNTSDAMTGSTPEI